jgi:hypothetical protein
MNINDIALAEFKAAHEAETARLEAAAVASDAAYLEGR